MKHGIYNRSAANDKSYNNATTTVYDYVYDPLDRLTQVRSGTPASPGATAQYYHQDGLGSVVGISTNLNTTTQTQRFDAWGNKLAGTIPQTAQYGYTGREPDETGLIYYRARYYDPTIGRFTQRDPAGMPDGVNRYAYVANNPVNFTDPLGLQAQDPLVIAQGGSNYFTTTLTDVGNWLYDLVPSKQSLNNFLDQAQTTLDVVGLAAQGPAEVVAPFIDVASAGVSLLRGDYAGAGLSGLAAIPVLGTVANAGKVARGLPDNALVCRGGSCTADKFVNGSGVTVDASGNLNGVSVNSAAGKSLDELTVGIPHNKVGVTTVGDVRKVGGDVIPSPTQNNPNHATLQGITPQQAQDLMTPTVKNPNTR